MGDSKDRALPASQDRAVVNGAGQAVSALRASVPSAGVCAFDLDECTVTLAFDTEAEVQAFLDGLPSRHRVWVDPERELSIAETRASILRHYHAQAIEARRAETQSGSVHESAVAESDAPNPSDNERTKRDTQ